MNQRFRDVRNAAHSTETALKKHKAGQVLIQGKNYVYDYVEAKKVSEARYYKKIEKRVRKSINKFDFAKEVMENVETGFKKGVRDSRENTIAFER